MRDSDGLLRDRSVIISNGFQRYVMAAHAAEISARGRLDRLITGPYPTPRVCRFIDRIGLTGQRRLGRLLDRAEAIPDDRVVALWWPEVPSQIGLAIRHRPRMANFSWWLEALGQRWYGRQAVRTVRASRASVYHYRAGFGGASVEAARRAGMITLVQHTVAHPAVLEYLVQNGGRFPAPGERGPITPMMKNVLEDIGRADVVMTDCAFVHQTFVHQGWRAEDIQVIEPGVDDLFLTLVPDPLPTRSGPIRLLFAGNFERRKGADALMRALPLLQGDWSVDVIGRPSPDMLEAHATMLRDPRVRMVGLVRRAELAQRMADSDVLVFASLAEGSARVNWEAMAAGSYVINTPNSGSIVEDGVHGAIVPPDDPPALARAIQWTLDHPEETRRVGTANAVLMRTEYTQARYGERLEAFYDRLIEARAATTRGAARP